MLKIISNDEEIPYPKDFPREEFLIKNVKIDSKKFEDFKSLIENEANERDVDKFIKENPQILIPILFSNRVLNSFGFWFLPKQMIKPKVGNNKGMIPDFILGGENSDGFSWTVIELKSPKDEIFKKDKNNNLYYFSSAANKGVFQLIEYVDCCEEEQAFLRDSFNLNDFRKPNGILLIGREFEFSKSKRKKKIKAAWNRINDKYIEIRTYDWLIRNLNELMKIPGTTVW